MTRIAAALRKRLAGPLEQECGATMVEFAFTFSAFLTFLFCFIEICLALYTHSLIAELARDGTRYAMVHGASCYTSTNAACEATAGQVNAYVSAIGLPNLAGGTLTPATVYAAAGSSTYSTTGSEAVGGSVQVTVTYAFPINLPFVPRNSLTMTSTAVRRIVQ